MRSAAEIYRDLLRLILAEGIEIRECHSSTAAEPAYFRRGLKFPMPAIEIVRPIGNRWYSQKPGESEIEPLLEGAKDLEAELITMAHEFGHHHSVYDEYEAVLKDFKADPSSVLSQDLQNLYDEELFAWERGKAVLRDLGFRNWRRFRAQRIESLKTYHRALFS
jgi:hypothetical protein